ISRVMNDVRTSGKGPGIGNIATKDSIEGLSAARCGHSSHLPTSKDGLGHSACGGSKMPPSAIWQFVDVAHTQSMTKVRGNRTFFRSYVVGVLNATLVHIAVCRSQ